MLLRLVHDTDLTEAQSRQLAAIRDRLHERWGQLHASSAETTRQLRSELATNAPDPARLHQQTQVELDAHAAVAHATADEVLALVATFSPAQKERLVARSRNAAGLEDSPVGPDDQLAVARFWTTREIPAATSSGPHARPSLVATTLFDRSSLTAEQRDVFTAMRNSIRGGSHAVHAFVRRSTPELVAELAKPTPDAAKIHALVDQALAFEASATHASIDRACTLRSTFTPSQIAALATR
jgi:Spy/CpxP family protein refolding chaperone